MPTATAVQTCKNGHPMTEETTRRRKGYPPVCRLCEREYSRDHKAAIKDGTFTAARATPNKFLMGLGRHKPMPPVANPEKVWWKQYILDRGADKLRGRAAIEYIVAQFYANHNHWPTIIICNTANVCEYEGIVIRVGNKAMCEPTPVSELVFYLR